MKNYLFITGLILFSLIPVASAQTTSCTPIFGGGQTCTSHPDLSINKQIQEIETKAFRDNLTAQSNYFTAGDAVVFRITVKNISNKTLKDVTMKDVLPASLIYRSSNIKFDTKTRTVSDTITSLDKGKSKTYTITTTVSSLAKTGGCIANQATVTQGGKTAADHTTFCVSDAGTNVRITGQSKGGLTTSPVPNQSKGGLPVYGKPNQNETPPTGPEMLGIIGLPFLASAGYFLRKKAI